MHLSLVFEIDNRISCNLDIYHSISDLYNNNLIFQNSVGIKHQFRYITLQENITFKSFM